jgi:F-type H+-transporting ATPase subunit gamma
MPNIRDIRRRIRSARSIQQITRAMKFVSHARLRKAQDRVIAARPYARQMLAVLNSLAQRAPERSHPLLAQRDGQNIELLVITADKGLCGAYNTNIIRQTLEFISRRPESAVELSVLGKRGRDFFRRRPSYAVRREAINVLPKLSFGDAAIIARGIIAEFEKGEIDQVWLVYNEFKSVIQQRVVVEPLLPIRKLDITEELGNLDYLYDEPPQKIFDHLLPHHVETQIFRALLEAAASEHGARMTAMEAATNNASEMIENLTLYANKVRQAGITKELIEVVSGAAGTGR